MRVHVTVVSLLYLNAAVAQKLQQACDVFRNASEVVSTAFLDTKCTVVIRFPNQPFGNITAMCNQALFAAGASCRVVLMDSPTQAITLTSQELTQPNDTYYINANRLDCNAQWSWTEFNGTVVPFTSSTIVPPAVGANCNQLNFGYMNGLISAVSPLNFPTSVFICECFDNPLLAPIAMSPPVDATTPLITGSSLPPMGTTPSSSAGCLPSALLHSSWFMFYLLTHCYM
ncbi:hypothetical protein AAVH_04497 [Aphelenchoides avenae]|nr:hypothetical protein AAVH_04497 [Aphelenchus avenae]